MIFNTYYALVIGLVFFPIFWILSGKMFKDIKKPKRVSGWMHFKIISTMIIGTTGLVLFVMWPNHSEPYMLDNSGSFAVGVAFGDSIFVRLDSQSDNIMVLVKGQDGTVAHNSKIVEGWPLNLSEAQDAQGILHSKLCSAVGFTLAWEWRFVDSDEYDNLFREKQVIIREKTIDKGISIR